MSQTLTVQVPSELYVRIKKRAEGARHTVEEEVADLLAASVPPDIDTAVAALELLDDAGVEQAARSRLADELAAELESLHLKQQREGLTDTESKRCAELVRTYERSMLLRAHAALVMKKRGGDSSHPIALP